jgi:hypothetical protein
MSKTSRVPLPRNLMHRLSGDAKLPRSQSKAAARRPTEEQVLAHVARAMASNARLTGVRRVAKLRNDYHEVGPDYGGDAISPVSTATLKSQLYKSPAQPSQAELDYLDELLTRLMNEKKLLAKMLGTNGNSTKYYWIPPAV